MQKLMQRAWAALSQGPESHGDQLAAFPSTFLGLVLGGLFLVPYLRP
jgi:hypothetical protein